MEFMLENNENINFIEQHNNIDESVSDNKTFQNIARDLKTMVLKAKCDDTQEALLSVVERIRKFLYLEPRIPISDLIDSDVISVLVDCLQKNDQPTLQYQASCVITGITYGTSDQTQVVVRNGAIPLLLNLLKSRNIEICNQAACALGNIIGDNPDLRNKIIDLDIVPRLLNLIKPDIPQPLLRTITWVFANICRDTTSPISVSAINKIFPAICKLIYNTDIEIVVNVTYALSYLAIIGKNQIRMITDSKLVPFLVSLLSHKEAKLQKAALRVIGNIAIEGDELIQVVLDCDILSHIPTLLMHIDITIVVETIWFLSNIMVRNQQQIQIVIDAGIIPLLIFQLTSNVILKQSEAAWAVCIFTVNGTKAQMTYLINQNILLPLCNLLKIRNVETVLVCLKSIYNILECADVQLNNATLQIEVCGGLDTIERLQSHESIDIYTSAYQIIDKYFVDDSSPFYYI